MLQWFKLIVFCLLGAYIGYALLFAVVLPGVGQLMASGALPGDDSISYLGEGPGDGRAVLISHGEDALRLRLELIAGAQERISISYHILRPGFVGDLLYGALFEAADRGVEVRILMDGIFHMLYGPQRALAHALALHPNMEYRLYEPLDVFRPWTWNNRLHDKLMIVDDQAAVITGRNLGDRYFLPPADGREVVWDWDVLCLGGSGVQQIARYFEFLWEHPYTKRPAEIRPGMEQAAEAKMRALRETLAFARQQFPQYFQFDASWQERAHPIYRAALLVNPITRGTKQPGVWAGLARLIHGAQHAVWVQSPYFIITKPMREYLDWDALQKVELILLTNSQAVSPNPLAAAGSANYRSTLRQRVAEIWEYAGVGSLHGKAVAVDDEISIIGSFNVDPRSTFLSTESMLVLHSPSFTRELKETMASYARQASPTPAPLWKRALILALRPFAAAVNFLL